MRKDIVFLMVLVFVAAGAVFAATSPAPQVGPVKAANEPETPVPTSTDPAYNDEYIDVFPVTMQGMDKDGGRHLDYIDSTALFDTFEGDCTAWASTDMDAGWFWRRDDTLHLPHLNDTSWWCADLCLNAPGFKGGYNDHWLQFLVSDTFDLTATTTPTLKFKARWKIEIVDGTDPPWDMWDGWNCWGSNDAGATWSVLGSVTPRYTGASSWAFGEASQGWGYGPGIPAFGDTNNQAWQEISYDLGPSSLAGHDSCMVRWAFASDQGWCSIDDPSFFCLVVDSIRVNTDQGIKLSNDGEQGEFTFDRGPGALGTWALDNTTYHSATQCWTVQNDTNLTIGLTSYPIALPTGYDFLTVRYWVWCDLPDENAFDSLGQPTNSLADYYNISISDAACPAYNQIVYDYGYDGSDAGWVQRTDGLISGGNPVETIDISAWSGQTVRLAFQCTTDDTLITGTGLHIDDVEIIASRRYAHDLALRDLVVPFPTTYGLQADLQYTVYNDGVNDENPIPTDYWVKRPDASTLISGSVNIAQVFSTGDDSTITVNWTPDVCGSHHVGANSNLTGDDDTSNDSLETPVNSPLDPNENLAVAVRPEGLYELGYHVRDNESIYFYPRYVRYTPVDDGVPAPDVNNYDFLQLKVMWMYHVDYADTGATVWIEFWEDSTEMLPSDSLIYRLITKIDTTETIGSALSEHWWTIDLDTIPALQNRSGDFWISISGKDSAIINATMRAVPNVMGMSPAGAPADSHNFILLDPVDGIEQSSGRFLVQVTIGEVTPVDNLTVFRSGVTNDVILRWSSPCPSVNVYRLTDPMQDYTTGTLLTPTPITATSYTDVGVVPSGKYFYVVLVAY